MAGNFAWVTYANNAKYFHAALVLAKSFEKVGSKYPVVLMMPSEMEAPYPVPSNVRLAPQPVLNYENSQLAHPRFRHCINKIYLWSLEEFDLVCWVDSDMIVVENPDELFDFPVQKGEIAAAPGCTCNHFRNPKLPIEPHLCPYGNPQQVYANAGLFVAKPDKATFKLLLEQDYDHPFAEQDTFNEVFHGHIHTLDKKFNFLHHLPLAHPGISEEGIKIFHFVFGKPWEGNTFGFHQHFYEMWTEMSKTLEGCSK